MKYIAIAIVLIASTTTVAKESPMQNSGIAAIKALTSGIVDSQISAVCLIQVDGAKTYIKNKEECSDGLNVILESLGNSDAALPEKTKIAEFKARYHVY